MTKDDIIRLAHEAGLHIATDHDWMPIIALAYAKKLVEIARAEEREACAKVCEEAHWSLDDRNEYASAIRARGQHESN